jgi:hypothetical protein
MEIDRAPEPSNILFENLKYTNCEKRMRRCFTVFLSILCLAVTTAAVFAAQRYQTIVQGTSCGTDFHPSREQVVNATGTPDAERTLQCYCHQLSAQDLVQNTGFCAEYIQTQTLNKLLVGATALGVTMVDWVLRRVVRKYGHHQHTPHTPPRVGPLHLTT